MIVGIGIDLIDNLRVERELARSNWLPDEGIFTRAEIAYCEAARKPAERYAACFAAKEAMLKALGLGLDDLALFSEAELRVQNSSHYEVLLHGRLKMELERLGVLRINLSVACNAQHTTAMVILED